MVAVLTIGTATDRIDLLDIDGWLLNEWQPRETSNKDTWLDSPLSSGRRLVQTLRGNAVETFTLKLHGSDHDDAVQTLRDMYDVLQKAQEYWTTRWQNEPVYIKAQQLCETNPRYCLVYKAEIPQLDNVFQQPFTSYYANAAMNDVDLIVERGEWRDQAPGDTSCVQVSGLQSWIGSQTSISASPGVGTDDGQWARDSFATGNTSILFGNDPATGSATSAFVRFVNVNVPQASTIVRAYIEFEASNSDSGTNCRAELHGEKETNPPTFSTAEDYLARTRTTASVDWPPSGDFSSATLPSWTANNTYETPDITTIIQEIVDQDGWEANNSLVIFVDDSASDSGAYRRFYSFEEAIETEPILYITYATEKDFGRTETCNDEVYVSNKHNRAQITDIYYYDDNTASFSGNLSGATTPFDLFPAVPGDSDILYLGINTDLQDSGPFASLVFDIGTAAVYSGDADIEWQYYNGAWTAFSTEYDNTDTTGGAFSEEGVNSIHWDQPSDWTTVAINGVTAYWVRAVLTFTSGGMTTPTQQNRDIYTVIWPYITIADDQVDGDLSALARVTVRNESGSVDAGRNIDRLIMSLRSTSRGTNFTPFLNWSDEQNPTNVSATVSVDPVGSLIYFEDDTTTPTGRRVTWEASGSTTVAEINISSPLTQEYQGVYHVFVRARQQGGTAGDVGVSLTVRVGLGTSVYSTRYEYFTVINQWQLLDFGRMTLTPEQFTDIDPVYISTQLDGTTSAGSGEELWLYDLIFMPIDEGAWEYLAGTRGSSFYALNSGSSLYLDSITFPRGSRFYIQRDSDSAMQSIWRPYSNQPTILQENVEQRLYFLTGYSSSSNEYSPGEIACRIQVDKVQRYISMRGNS